MLGLQWIRQFCKHSESRTRVVRFAHAKSTDPSKNRVNHKMINFKFRRLNVCNVRMCVSARMPKRTMHIFQWAAHAAHADLSLRNYSTLASESIIIIDPFCHRVDSVLVINRLDINKYVHVPLVGELKCRFNHTDRHTAYTIICNVFCECVDVCFHMKSFPIVAWFHFCVTILTGNERRQFIIGWLWRRLSMRSESKTILIHIYILPIAHHPMENMRNDMVCARAAARSEY